MHAQVKVVIATTEDKDSPTFGRGAALLLRGVEDTGSLNKAAKNLQMAYSKAWKMLSKLEASLGFALIERHGSRGSVVTDRGKDLLRRYEEFERRVDEYAREEFKQLTQ